MKFPSLSRLFPKKKTKGPIQGLSERVLNESDDKTHIRKVFLSIYKNSVSQENQWRKLRGIYPLYSPDKAAIIERYKAKIRSQG